MCETEFEYKKRQCEHEKENLQLEQQMMEYEDILYTAMIDSNLIKDLESTYNTTYIDDDFSEAQAFYSAP